MQIDEAKCHWNWNYGSLEIYLIGHSPNVDTIRENCCHRERLLVPAVEGKPIPKDGSQVEPSLRLSVESAQQLMDALAGMGLRPTGGYAGGDRSLAATEKHLNDMRAIVSKQMGVSFDAVQR